MKWPPWKRRPDETDIALEADRARLAEVCGQWQEVRASARRLDAHRRRNHFAESIATIYRGRP